jgi:hypothetical protein
VSSAHTAFGGVSTDFGAKFASDMQSLQTTSKANISYTQTRIRIDPVKLPSPDSQSMIEFVNQMDKSYVTSSAVVSFTTTSYETLDNRLYFGQINKYSRLFRPINSLVPGLSTLAVQAMTTQSYVKTAQKIYQLYYCETAEPKFHTAYTNLQGFIVNVQNWRDTVADNPTLAGIASPTYDPSIFYIPHPVYTLNTGDLGGCQIDESVLAETIDLSQIPILIHPTEFHIKTVRTVNDGLPKIWLGFDVIYETSLPSPSSFVESFTDYGQEVDSSPIFFGLGETIIYWRAWNGNQVNFRPQSDFTFIATSMEIRSNLCKDATEPNFADPYLNEETWTSKPSTCFVSHNVYMHITSLLDGTPFWSVVTGIQVQYVEFSPC